MVQRGSMQRLAYVVCLALSAVVVWWVRVSPLSLAGADDLAERVARYRVRSLVIKEAGNVRLSARELETRVRQWIERNPQQFAREQNALVTQYHNALHYEDGDGYQHVYLGQEDSYTWLRLAQNFSDRGTSCDAIVHGECRDTFVNPPWGTKMVYGWSLHVGAITWVQRAMQLFRPHYPLPATSFMVTVIAGVLGVVPAFAIGWRIGGLLGGVSAAIVIGTAPVFMGRTIGSDNDVWNIVLPLFMMWAALNAVAAISASRRIGWALVAGLCVALHAVTWSGWTFTFVILLAALVANVALEAVYAARRGRRLGGGTEPVEQPPAVATPAVRSAVVVLLVYYLSAGAFCALAGIGADYFRRPLALVGIGGAIDAEGTETIVESGVWPDVLATVSELQATALGKLVRDMGGPVIFVAALGGLMLIALPRERWKWMHWGVCGAGLLMFVGLAAGAGMGRWATIAVATLPALLAGALAFMDRRSERFDRAAALVVGAWFVAGLFAAFAGDRFELLLVPGFGLATGAGLGRVHESASAAARRYAPRFAMPISIVVFAALASALVRPVQQGYQLASRFLPDVDDAWWGALTKIKERTAADAIVNTWWDYGYWVKFVANRRVTADGSMLRTHLPFWIGRALVSTTESEAVGLLRMLNCGSDATPFPEGKRGAYGRILAKVRDGSIAQGLVVQLAGVDREAAAALLDARGFSASERDDVLAATHCTPPESYLVIGSELTRKDMWMRFGLWDFNRAYISEQSTSVPQASAVADFVRRFGYSEAEASRLYEQARTTPRTDFVIGQAPRAPSVWYSCGPGREAGRLQCPLGLTDTSTHTLIENFVFDVTDPRRSRFHIRKVEPGRDAGPSTEIAAGALVVAGSRLEDVQQTDPTYATVGVLADTTKWRVLIGPPPFVRSVFAQLLFLDGRYAARFEKFDERLTFNEDRLLVWKVKF